jgi:hypothetical protein
MDEMIRLVKSATADYLLTDLYAIVKEFLRPQLYLIGGSSSIVIWDGAETRTLMMIPDTKPVPEWPCVCVTPDQRSICIAGGLPCVYNNNTNCLQYDLVLNSWSRSSPLNGLQEFIEKAGALVTRSKDSFSIFSICGSVIRQLFPDIGRIVKFPQSPIVATETAYPVYDSRNDVIWVISNHYRLAKYVVTEDKWIINNRSTTMARRSGWVQLCLPTHANVVYVVGGDEHEDKSSIDEYDVLTDEWRTICFETPLIIPPKIIGQHQSIDLVSVKPGNHTTPKVAITSVTNWRQIKFVVAVFDGEILFIGGYVHVNYQQVTYSVIDFTHTLITSYNPITTKRTLVTTLPTINSAFPIVIV